MSKDEKNKSKARKASYEVLTGLNYGDRRAEAGETVSDLPASSIGWLLEQGHIKRVEESETN
jgi:hypothetical protein